MSDYIYKTTASNGVATYHCYDCDFTIMRNIGAINRHCRLAKHGLPKVMTEVEFMEQEMAKSDRPSVMITFAYLCWNTRQASTEGLEALYAEGHRLRQLGCRSRLIAVDNGSSDGTFRNLCEVRDLNMARSPFTEVRISRFGLNIGISRARNFMLDDALDSESDHILMMDGDIEVVPYSSYVMARYLQEHSCVGCIGAYSSSYTGDRQKASTILAEIPENRVRDNIRCAWTQYGLFRLSMFGSKVWFDESGPFSKPGWGYEDEDLYYQMMQAGYGCKYFLGMVYLHRNLHSSWPALRDSGVDVEKTFSERKVYLAQKWKARRLPPAILSVVMKQQMARTR